MQKKPTGHSFFWVLLKMNMLPLILLTLVLTMFSTVRFAASINTETQNGLMNLCYTVITLYDNVYEGDYHIVNDSYLMKGNHQLNGDFTIIDSIKEKTGVDITIFYQDTRVITTIQKSDGTRAIGTKANDIVVKDVLNGGHPCFYSSTMVEGVRYFSYYEPLYASDGACIGMIFLGKPSAEVERLVFASVSPIIIFGILTMLIVCLVTTRFSSKLVNAIRITKSFVESITGGELHTKFDENVLKRNDELGEMGNCLIEMQKSLQGLVEQDILTGLYNRRGGENLLRQTCENYRKDGTPFCVAIGDIDHFKNVNDTYGHECGDVMLAKISSQIKEHMQGRGFVARWGGEEMLLVYNNIQLDTAVAYLNELLEEIRSQRIAYGDTIINVTMTFGIIKGNDGKVEHIVRDADAKMYEGKNSGRNRIVYDML